MSMSLVLLTCVSLLVVFASPVVAAPTVIAADLTFDIDGTTKNFANSMVGWDFEVTTSLSITGLGWFDAYGDGLSASHEIGIWNTSEQLLLSTNIPSGTSAALGDDSFRYVPTQHLALQPGTTYVIAGLTTGDAYIVPGEVNQDPSSATYAPEITFIGAAAGNAPFQYPAFHYSPPALGRFGPNFTYVVPEPGTAGIVLLGGLLAWRKRRKKELGARG